MKELTYWNNGKSINFLALKGVSVTPNLPEGTVIINIPQLYLVYGMQTGYPKPFGMKGSAGYY
ncbi:hypothetical protein [Providencia hangzhouensis]|uniref:hypothetical protein n=1 Tax=Providencia hangzhouensis TaxID=3031799 RepID=UPI00397D8B76